jgi:hypothetical protein
MNLFSSGQLSSYKTAFENLHESFGRDVVVFKESERVTIEEVDDNFNYFYRKGRQNSVSETLQPVSGVFKMRIKWLDPNKVEDNQFISQIRPEVNANLCRLKMDEEAFNFISGAQVFMIDGRTCDLAGFSRPHGLVENQFFTIFAKETK